MTEQMYPLTRCRLDLLQMSLNQDGAFQRTLGFDLGCVRHRVPGLLVDDLFLFDADQHLGEEKALQILPRLAIFAHTNSAIQDQFAKSVILLE